MAPRQRHCQAGRRPRLSRSRRHRPHRSRAPRQRQAGQDRALRGPVQTAVAQRTLEVTRMHWSVENQLHWRLDVVFNEDDARTRKNYGPENLAVLRRIALDILRAHPDNRSVGRKMNLSAWKKDFFFELFAHLQYPWLAGEGWGGGGLTSLRA